MKSIWQWIVVTLLLAAPVAGAVPPGQGNAPIMTSPPIGIDAEASEDEGMIGMSEPARAQMKLVMARDVLPMMTQNTMALFIWQADPAAACEAGKAVAAAGLRLNGSVATLRQIMLDNGDDVAGLDAQVRGLMSRGAGGIKVQARFCDHMVAQNLNARDKAAFKKGAAMLGVVLSELQAAIDAKMANDDARTCVSMHVVAATASDFQDFITSEAQGSEVMATMKRSRVMEMTAEIRDMAESTLPDCKVG